MWEDWGDDVGGVECVGYYYFDNFLDFVFVVDCGFDEGCEFGGG